MERLIRVAQRELIDRSGAVSTDEMNTEIHKSRPR
jgi:hypothetical protein